MRGWRWQIGCLGGTPLAYRVPHRLSREVAIAYGICQIKTNMYYTVK
jgi:hypothetical protein